MVWAFRTPKTILTGPGAFDQIGVQASGLGRRALIVTGHSAMRRQGWLDKAVALLDQAGVAAALFEGVEPEPSLDVVDRAREEFHRHRCDLVVGLGGGSAMDVAKAVAGLAEQKQPTSAFFDGLEMAPTPIPIICAPSTFGTGSEATTAIVLTDKRRRIKKSIRHQTTMPTVALVDGRLGLGTPANVTAACGMDALTQAIESYISIHANALTMPISLAGVELLLKGLPRAFRSGADLDARCLCAEGSLMAGIALSEARLGIVHGLAHPLGGRYGLPHGELCGILLPYALRFNRPAVADRYDRLGQVMGGDPAEVCEGLLRDLGLPAGLGHAGIPTADFQAIATESLPSGSTKANPRPVGHADAVRMLEEVCGVK